MIIGLVGKNAAGKGEVVKFLTECGFNSYSLSDMIREELIRQGRQVTRDELLSEGTRLRTVFGPGVLAERLVDKLHCDKNYVIDSIRNPAEVAVLRRLVNFKLVAVDAAAPVRFERIKARGREGDPTTFEAFKLLEERERDSTDPHSQLLEKTLQSEPEFTVTNNTTRDELQKQLREVLTSCARTLVRPGWDEYFMRIAQVVASRGNCAKRQVAAVIVKDKRIISTGYNGTPRGITNCYEGGCPRCNAFGKSGEALDECLCSHAEENAITQAAYHGVSIKQAMIYSTFSPCLMCTKMIINSGISEVVYNAEYSISAIPLQLLQEAGITVRQVSL